MGQVKANLLLVLLAVWSARVASDTSLLEVDAVSWSGDRIRQLSLRFINQASDVLECAAAAAKHMLADHLLVFIGGSGAQESQCILGRRIRCEKLRGSPENPAATNTPRVFVTSLENCSTTIQHRVNNSVDFYRNWEEYAAGFGQGPQGNFWIGLRTLHSLTWPTARSLRVRIKKWDNTEYWADYTSFSVASEAEKFRLSVSGFRAAQGNIGDSLAYHNGMMFSTFNFDNDQSFNANCAMEFKGGWWFNACHNVLPTGGSYYTPPNALQLATADSAKGVSWFNPFGHTYSLMEFEMLIY